MQTVIDDVTKKLHRVATRCYTEISDVFCSIFITQKFKNGSNENLEGVMTIPIPSEGNVVGVSAKLNDKPIKHSIVLPKEVAANRYEENIEKGQSPILVKHTADGYITLNLGTLEPEDEVEIELELAQKLTVANNKAKLIIPTAITPKYGDPIAAGYEPQEIPSVNLLAEQPFCIHVHLKDNFAEAVVESAYQALEPVDGKNITNGKDWENNGSEYSVVVCFDKLDKVLVSKEDLYSNRDFVLDIELPDGYQSKVLQTENNVAGGVVAGVNIYEQFDKSTIEPKVHVLVDCSGSMGGGSKRLARACVENLGRNLPENSQTALSFFGSRYHPIYPLARENNGERLAHDSNQINADLGGTELERSLLEVMRREELSGADILLITDGAIYGNEGILQSLNENSNRVFTVAIGTSSSHELLKEIATWTNGMCVSCHSNEDISDAMKTIIDSISRSKIKITEINWPGYPEWKSPLPKVIYNNVSATAYAFYTEVLPVGSNLDLTIINDGKNIHKEFTFDNATAPSKSLITHAARERIFSITGNQELRTKLAIDYQILTNNTSMFIPNLRADNDKVYSDNTQTIDHMMTDSHGFDHYDALDSVGVHACYNKIQNVDEFDMYEPRVARMESFESNRILQPLEFSKKRRSPERFSSITNISKMIENTTNSIKDLKYGYNKPDRAADTIAWITDLFEVHEEVIILLLKYIDSVKHHMNPQNIPDHYLIGKLHKFKIYYDNPKDNGDKQKIDALIDVITTLMNYSRNNKLVLPYKRIKIATSPINFLHQYLNNMRGATRYHSSVIKKVILNYDNYLIDTINTEIANKLIRKFNLNSNYIRRSQYQGDIFTHLVKKSTPSKWNVSTEDINRIIRSFRMSRF